MVRGVGDSLPFYVGRLLVEWLVFLGSCMVLVGVWALVLLVAWRSCSPGGSPRAAGTIRRNAASPGTSPTGSRDGGKLRLNARRPQTALRHR